MLLFTEIKMNIKENSKNFKVLLTFANFYIDNYYLQEQLKNLRMDLDNAHTEIRQLRDREENWDTSRFQVNYTAKLIEKYIFRTS